MAIFYDAPRNLVEVTARYTLDADGFPVDASWFSPSGYVDVENVLAASAVALIGEPGIGKSTVIEHLCADIAAVQFVHLDEITSVADFERALADAVQVTELPTLVLDGLDEWSLPQRVLGRRLGPFLEAHPGLRIIIGCRSAYWSDELTDVIKRKRPDFVAYELVPLSARAVKDAAAVNGLDGDEFVAEVRRVGVVSLATRPLTLNMLLDLYVEDQRLPGSPAELFSRGVTVLAGEPDVMRGAARDSRGTAEQRTITSSRLAACLAVSGRAALTFASPAAATDIDLATLAGGTEKGPAGEFEVTPTLVQDTVETALFVGRGKARFVPIHASVASYLAARYLVDHHIPENQLRAMLTRGAGLVDVGIPTQLHETAAWLLALEPEASSWIADVAPDIPLTHAAYIRDDFILAKLVDVLLKDRDLAIRMRWRPWRLLRRGLYEQLLPHLRAPLHQDSGTNFMHPVSARAATAIDIAVQSHDVRAVDILLELALSHSVNPPLRARAATGVLRLDPQEAARRFQPLLDEVAQHPQRDPHDELRGLALDACARHLSAEQLIDALRQPRQDKRLIGHYSMFVASFVEHCTQEQVRGLVRLTRREAAAREVLLKDGTGRRASALARLLHRVYMNGDWRDELWDDAAWLAAFCIRSHASLVLPRDVFDGEDGAQLRRELGLAVVRALPENRLLSVTRPVWLADDARDDHAQGRAMLLIGPDDFTWLCTAAVEVQPESWVRLIKQTYNPDLPEHVNLLVELSSTDRRFAWVPAWLAQIATQDEIDNEFELESEWSGRDEHARRLTAAAELVANGNVEACGELVALLAIQPESGYRVTYSQTNLGRWPGWALIELTGVSIDLSALARACAEYVARAAIPDGDWVTQVGAITHSVLDLAAMVELVVREPEVQLPPDTWQRLVTVLVRSPFDPTDDEDRRAAIKCLAEHTPVALQSEALRFIEEQFAAGWSSSVGLWMLEDTLDAPTTKSLIRLARVIAKRIDRAESKLLGMNQAPASGSPEARLLAATQQEFLGLRNWLDSILELLLARPGNHLGDVRAMLDTETTTVRAQVGVHLFRNRQATWAEIWGRCEAQDELGTEVAKLLSYRIDHDSRLLSLLTPSELGNLWRWLASRWSPETDQWESGFVASEQRLRDLRNATARQLESRGTLEALEVLGQLSVENGGDGRLGDMALALTTRLRDEHWEGTSPVQLFDLVADASRVVVHDADSLFRLLITLLDKLAERLHGIGELLWNEIPPSKTAEETVSKKTALFRPKNEAHISLLVHDHLRDELGRGLIVNREVLVRQTTSKGAGLLVDVLATAVGSEGGGQQIVCPIEIKGNWNENLLTDLRAQLVDDYMKDLQAGYGVYVYAWFDVTLWSDKDDRRLAQVKKLDPATVAAKLEEAAAEALAVGARVHVQRLDIPRAVPSARASS